MQLDAKRIGVDHALPGHRGFWHPGVDLLQRAIHDGQRDLPLARADGAAEEALAITTTTANALFDMPQLAGKPETTMFR